MQYSLLTELHVKQTNLQFINQPTTSAESRLSNRQSEVFLSPSTGATSYRELLNMELKQ